MTYNKILVFLYNNWIYEWQDETDKWICSEDFDDFLAQSVKIAQTNNSFKAC